MNWHISKLQQKPIQNMPSSTNSTFQVTVREDGCKKRSFFLTGQLIFSTQLTKVIPLVLKARFILHALALTSKPWTSKRALQILTEFMDASRKAKARRKSQTYHFSLPPPTCKRTRMWTLWGPQETKESLNSLELLAFILVKVFATATSEA